MATVTPMAFVAASVHFPVGHCLRLHRPQIIRNSLPRSTASRKVATVGGSGSRGTTRLQVQVVSLYNPDELFGRQEEQQALHTMLGKAPSAIEVVLGPINTGKTKLLEEVFGSPSSSTEMILVEGRDAVLMNPTELARHLAKQGGPLDRVVEWLKSIPGTTKAQQLAKAVNKLQFRLLVRSLFEYRLDPNPIHEALDILDQACNDAAKQGHRLAIFVNYAHVLMSWEEKHSTELGALLRFMVKVSSEDKAAHVVLETYDYCFCDWLVKRSTMVHLLVIGDLPEHKARIFFQECVLPFWLKSNEPVPLSDDNWKIVFKVSGGNPGTLLLRSSGLQFEGSKLEDGLEAAKWSETVDWARAVTSWWSNFESKVTGAAFDGPWTRQQYLLVVERLLASEYHAVPMDELIVALGEGGEAALMAMVRKRLLSVRPPSALSFDIPRDAYGKDGHDTLITADAEVLYCMEVNHEWLKGLQVKDEP